MSYICLAGKKFLSARRTLPAVLNAANEVAVGDFIRGRRNFPQISQTVARVMERHTVTAHPRLEQILEADAWARREALIMTNDK